MENADASRSVYIPLLHARGGCALSAGVVHRSDDQNYQAKAFCKTPTGTICSGHFFIVYAWLEHSEKKKTLTWNV